MRMTRSHLTIASGVAAIILIALACVVIPWWSSGSPALISMSLDLTRVSVCMGPLCEQRWYSELPRQAFSTDPTKFVAIGRMTLGLGAAGALALVAHFATARMTTTKISPARLSFGLFAFALLGATAFFAMRPDIVLLDPAGSVGPQDELEGAFTAALVPELRMALGFPAFAIGATAGIAASILAMRRRVGVTGRSPGIRPAGGSGTSIHDASS